MNNAFVRKPCPHCGREIDIKVEFNGNGVIEPTQVFCQDPYAATVGCQGYFTIQGKVETIIHTAITPIPKLADALKVNGNGHTVPAEGVTP